MEVTIDGARIFYHPVGSEGNYPLVVLHGGPGLDHTLMHPWLDDLSDTFRLFYVDERGQGRSQRVDPSTLSLERFAADVTLLAQALGLERYALLGHSFGAFIALTHAIEQKDATHYIISGGTASFTKTAPELHENLAAFEPVELRDQVIRSWAMEPTVASQEEAGQILAMQMPFHFSSVESEGYRRHVAAGDTTVYAPEVLAHFARNEYSIELEDRLREVDKPTLVMTGEYDRTCTPRAAREMADGIRGAELFIVAGAGHMSFMEEPALFCDTVRSFFNHHR
jgi:proline-specific peptidase